MSSETELSCEKDPTEQMIEQQERAQERAERDENDREHDHEGEVQTEDFDLEEALSVVSNDDSTADDVTSESSESNV